MFKKDILICLIVTSWLCGCAETPNDVLHTNETATSITQNQLSTQLDDSIEKIVQKVQNGEYGYLKFADDVQINVSNIDVISIVELQKKSMDFNSYVDISKECFGASNDGVYFWKPFTTDYVIDEQGNATYLEPKLLSEYPNNTDSGYLMYQNEDKFQMTVYYSNTAQNYSNFQYRYISNALLGNISASYVDMYNAWEDYWHSSSNFEENDITVLETLSINSEDVSNVTWNLNGTDISVSDSIEAIENTIYESSQYILDSVSFKVKNIYLCEYSNGQQALCYDFQAYFGNFPIDYNTTNYNATNNVRDSFQGNAISLDGYSIDFYNNPFPILEGVNSTERYNDYLTLEQALSIVQGMLSDTINYSFNEVNLEYSIVLADDDTITLEPCYCFVMDDPKLSTSKVYLWVNAITGEKDSSIYVY